MSFLGDILVEVIGGVIADAFGPKKKAVTFRESANKASYGSVSAFFGFLGILFSTIALFSAVYTPSYDALSGISVCGIAVACVIDCYFARRIGLAAPTVTERNLGLAKFGTVMATVGLWASALSIAIVVGRMALGLLRVAT
jgi:hypothetical protein